MAVKKLVLHGNSSTTKNLIIPNPPPSLSLTDGFPKGLGGLFIAQDIQRFQQAFQPIYAQNHRHRYAFLGKGNGAILSLHPTDKLAEAFPGLRDSYIFIGLLHSVWLC